MQYNHSFLFFLSTLPEEKRRADVKEIVEAVVRETADMLVIEDKQKKR